MNAEDFTEDARVAAAAYRLAAVADGWESEPLYQNEPEEHAAKLRSAAGFVMHVIARSPDDRPEHVTRRAPEGGVHVWGPDGLAVRVGRTYSREEIDAGLTTCNNCGARAVRTFRYSFAGRACAACLPEMRRLHERRGWAD